MQIPLYVIIYKIQGDRSELHDVARFGELRFREEGVGGRGPCPLWLH